MKSLLIVLALLFTNIVFLIGTANAYPFTFGTNQQYVGETDSIPTSVSVMDEESDQDDSDNWGDDTHKSVWSQSHRRGVDVIPGEATLGYVYPRDTGDVLHKPDSFVTIGNANYDKRDFFDNTVLGLQTSGITNGEGYDIAVTIGASRVMGDSRQMANEAISLGVSDSLFWYEAPSDFIVTNTFTNTSTNITYEMGYVTYLYDLSELGIAEDAMVSSFFLSNFNITSTVSGGDASGMSGWINMEGMADEALIAGGPGESGLDGYNSYYSYYEDDPDKKYDFLDPDIMYFGSVAPNAFPYQAPRPISNPEPSTLILLGLGLVGLAVVGRKRKHA